MADFSIIPSQFDTIVPNHPIVFISYSWDNKEHRAWVRKFSDDLRAIYSINTLLDQYNRGGYDLIQFMTKAIDIAERVLIIGTPIYKDKIDKSKGGGANFEDQLISNELYSRITTNKFIPVLRKGKFDTSFTSIIVTRNGYDFCDDTQYDHQLKKLAAEIWNAPLNAPPALGPKPRFSTNFGHVSSDISFSKSQITTEEFVAETKRLLNEPYGEIAFTELIESEAKEAYNAIQSHASYDFAINPDLFGTYLDWHLQAVDKLIAASLPIVRYGTIKQQRLLVSAIVKLCMKPFKNGEITREGTNYLHLLGASLLFHSMGIACVKFHYFQILKVMMTQKVTSGNIMSPSYGCTLAYLAGVTHWSAGTMNEYLQSHYYYPFSEFLINNLYTYFREEVIDKDDFRNIFCAWEHLHSLMFNYYKCGIVEQHRFPLGHFVIKRIDLSRGIDDFYTYFMSAAKEENNQWAPLKDGLFDGKYQDFLATYNRAEEYFKANGRW